MSDEVISAVINLWLSLFFISIGAVAVLFFRKRKNNFISPQSEIIISTVASKQISRTTRVTLLEIQGQRWLLAESGTALTLCDVTESRNKKKFGSLNEEENSPC